MPENTLVTPFLGSFMTAIFIFSTIYTVAFYWGIGAEQAVTTSGISDNPVNPVSTVGSLVDWILEGASWLSPFALVKKILIEQMAPTPEIYTILNLLVLRPVGWVVVLFEANFIVSKIPTVSSEV